MQTHTESVIVASVYPACKMCWGNGDRELVGVANQISKCKELMVLK